MAVVSVVSSLQNYCLRAVVHQLPEHESSLQFLPLEVKTKLVHLMSKRGLLSDKNLAKVLHSSIAELDLSECKISDRGLWLLAACKQLKKLDLNAVKESRENITSDGIAAVARSCPYLHTIYLRRCLHLTDTAVAAIAENCTHLRHLNLSGCLNVTDVSLKVIAKECRLLQSLNVARTQVSDDGVVFLTQGTCASTLKELHLGFCIAITDTSIEAIVSGCPSINILIFHGCPLVTDRSRQAIEWMSLRSGSMKQLSWTVY